MFTNRTLPFDLEPDETDAAETDPLLDDELDTRELPIVSDAERALWTELIAADERVAHCVALRAELSDLIDKCGEGQNAAKTMLHARRLEIDADLRQAKENSGRIERQLKELSRTIQTPEPAPEQAEKAAAVKKGKRPPPAKRIDLDYRKQQIPAWIREVINASMEIEAEDAKSAGQLGFMARAMVLATLPYKDPKADVFRRVNGNFKLRIVAGYDGGLPFGIYPRLLVSWVATEAVRNQSPIIELGDSLAAFLRDVLDLRSTGGGARGTSTRVNEQMKRLFGSLITAEFSEATQKDKSFVLRNVTIADELAMTDDLDLENKKLWTPQEASEAGAWKSQVRLSNNFFQECVTNPVPIDLRAYKALRGSPLAMDLYTWLTYRMSYTQRRSRPIRWESLMAQLGCNYGTDPDQAVRDFKKAFLKAMKAVLTVYPQAKIEVLETGLVLLPSPPHVKMQAPQVSLF